ncbi:MAG: ThuA domain-containing protein [Candidatus Latescibacteria bacterium]|nr:ThuA domain-containing protein [Candidatus Latescibacterota bacterium]
MKKVLLLINPSGGVFADFAAMFTRIVEASGQFQLQVSHDRARLENLSEFDAVALYIGGGELSPVQEQGITGFVRKGGGLLGVHGANAGLVQYKDYTEMIGSEFVGHDPLAPFDVETVADIDDALPRLSKTFRIADECYNLKIHTEAPLRYFQHGHWRLDRKPLGYLRG